MTVPLEERFWAKVNKTADCWLWTAAKMSSGYGQTSVEGKKLGAHRVAYELLVGPIPDGDQLDHLCRTRLCVNPAHLEPVATWENTLRGLRSRGIDATPAAANPDQSKWGDGTHCVNGHPMDGANLQLILNGHGRRFRRCRTCRNEWFREYRRAKREAAAAARSDRYRSSVGTVHLMRSERGVAVGSTPPSPPRRRSLS